MSFVLVVVAAITLVIGLLQSGLGIIYVSIACSVLAGVVLFVAVLRGKPDAGRAAAPAGPGYARPPEPAPAAYQAPSAAPVGSSPPPPPPMQDREPVLAGVVAGRAEAEASADRTDTLDQAAIEEAVAVGGESADPFPIHDYDVLRATEILPMLADLSEDQLEAVQAREQAGKGRSMILKRVGDELEKRRRTDDWDADDEGWDDSIGTDVADDVDDDLPAPAVASGEFPIPDYEELKALDVLGRLPDLNVAELRIVRRREEQGLRRAMVLNRVDRLIEEAPPEAEVLVPPPSAPVAKRKYTRKSVGAPVIKKAPAARRAPVARPSVAKAPAPGSRRAPLVPPAPKRAPVARKAAPPVAKAPAARARAAKAPVAKAPVARVRVAKAPVAKARVARSGATKFVAPSKPATKR